jgi:hypothetical protein
MPYFLRLAPFAMVFVLIRNNTSDNTSDNTRNTKINKVPRFCLPCVPDLASVEAEGRRLEEMRRVKAQNKVQQVQRNKIVPVPNLTIGHGWN